MERPVRLIVFLLLSLTVHLLVLWSGMTHSDPAGRAHQHGVRLIARSAEHFLWRPPLPRHEAEPQVRANPAQTDPTKPAPPPQRLNEPRFGRPAEVREMDRSATEKKRVEKSVVESEAVPEPEPQSEPDAAAEPQVTGDIPGQGESVKTRLDSSSAPDAAPADGLAEENTAAATTGFQQALPRYELNPLPYPDSARRRGQEGTVRLEVLVGVAGRVVEVRLVESSGHRVLDRAALRAVRRWRFKPATSYGQAVASRVVIPVDFVLHTRQ